MINWTDDQQKVISSRNGNILVSAAAGSGKTAVLVERIIQMVLDKDHPLDVDRLVVVTFTNAAASEMRERIVAAIEARLLVEPENEHLRKQATLINNAQITTIHSFCGYIIKNYFHRIDLDPSYRMMDENETALISADALTELIEEAYEEENENFSQLMNLPMYDRSDRSLENQIMQIYRMAVSNPWPDLWYDDLRHQLSVDSVDELEENELVKSIVNHIHILFAEFTEQYGNMIKICEPNPELEKQAEFFKQEQRVLDTVNKASSFDEIYLALSQIEFVRYPGGKKSPIAKEINEEVKASRDAVKKAVIGVKESFCYADPHRQVEVLKKNSQYLLTLIDLAKQYGVKFAKKKQERNVIDFNDLEHFAIRILTTKDEQGNIIFTPAADELADSFQEIIVDEYQDSNLVQETILNAVSKVRFNHPNIFMVGDVKQSIYKFRLARPELFSEKLSIYTTEENPYRRIDLHQNFRSRESVLSAVNFICKDIMRYEIGGVVYDDAAALYKGATFSQPIQGDNMKCEVLIVKKQENSDEEDLELDLSPKEREAYAIAQRIHELTDKETGAYVADKEGQHLANYSDIVILLRSITGWADVYEKVLTQMGIPVVCEAGEDFYQTKEIQTVMALLNIIDNPLQDIALAAVLRSPMYNFSDEELAILRGIRRKRKLYIAIKEYALLEAVPDGEEKLQKKIQDFLQELELYRSKKCYLTVYELLQDIYQRTGYYHYVMTMSAGEQRIANLNLLLQKASDYGKVSYQGLYHFMRYVEHILHNQRSEEESKIAKDQNNCVRIMSIHKSKGLEFPVCIVAGLGKKFNRQDNNQWIICHPDFGIASDYFDKQSNSMQPTLFKQLLKFVNDKDMLGEELRVLYVAMTRAKEKLILVGSVGQFVGVRSKWIASEKTYYLHIMQATTYLDLLMPSILTCDENYFDIKWLTEENLVTDQLEQQVAYLFTDVLRHEINPAHIYHEPLNQEINERRGFIYPYLKQNQVPIKVSVSDIKHKYMDDDFETNHAPVPAAEHAAQSGAAYGTIIHQVMACLPFEGKMDTALLSQKLALLVQQGNITAKDAELVNLKKVCAFFESDLGERMCNAYHHNQLYREQPFVIGVPANEIDYDGDELVLVQGIIDGYFVEDKKLVLMDYKTDRLAQGEEERLVKRYFAQIDLYQRALTQITKMEVKEMILYSFSLSKEIRVDVR